MNTGTLIRLWQDAGKELEKFKALELKLRNQLIKKYPGGFGTSHNMVDKKTDLVISRGINLSLDKDVLDSINEELTEEERQCVVYKPGMDKRRYDKLPEDSLLMTAVTAKPALPTIKVVIDED